MGRSKFENRLLALILADDPLATLEFPLTLDLMPLYVCWEPRRDSLKLPIFAALLDSVEAFAPDGLDAALRWLNTKAPADLRDWVIGVGIEKGGKDYVYRHYGAAIAASVGRDNTGTRLSLMARHSASARIYAPGYAAIARRGLPLYTESANTAGLAVKTWRRLIVPVFGPRRKVDGYLVANVPAAGLPD
jgi:hypothetical protein